MPVSVSPLASGTYSYDAGTSGTVTVPAGCKVTLITAASTAGGTITITPKGANQTGTAGAAIPVPAGGSWSRDWMMGGPLGPGTIIAFATTVSYYVEYSKGDGA